MPTSNFTRDLRGAEPHSLFLFVSLSISLCLSVWSFCLSFVCAFSSSIFTIMAAHQSALKCNAASWVQNTMRATFGPARCHLPLATCHMPVASCQLPSCQAAWLALKSKRMLWPQSDELANRASMRCVSAKRQAYKTGFMPRRTATDRRHEEARTHTNPLRILVKKCATKSTWKRKTKTTPQLVTLRKGEKETRQPQEAAIHTSYFINVSA